MHYKNYPEPFDWLQKYSAFKEMMGLYLKPTDNILVVGCGNSRLSEDMYDDGYEKITNIDTSERVIQQMREKYRDRPTLVWEVMDIFDCVLDTEDNRKELTAEGRLPVETLDGIVIKATMDVFCCGDNYEHHVDKMLTECSRLLKPKGVLFIISLGLPGDPSEYDVDQGNRIAMIEKEEFLWEEVRVHAVHRPLIDNSCSIADTADPTNMHYIYVCRKVEIDPTKDSKREARMRKVKDEKFDPNK
jgi:SAM-dependent methyltransferase